MYNVILIFILLYLLLDYRTEPYEYKGTNKTIHEISLTNPKTDMSMYQYIDTIAVNNDLIEDFVILTNKYLSI